MSGVYSVESMFLPILLLVNLITFGFFMSLSLIISLDPPAAELRFGVMLKPLL